MKASFWILLNMSLVIFIVGLALVFGKVGDATVASILSEKLAIHPRNKLVYENWKSPKPALTTIYLWNIDNVDAVARGQKPKLTEIGPFCYERYVNKVNITRKTGGKVFYRNKVYFVEHKVPHMNCLPTSTSVTSFSVPYALVMRTLQDLSLEYQTAFLDIIPDGWGIFVHKTAEELIWGYQDPLLEILQPFLSGLSSYGYYMGFNNTLNNEFEIEDGSNDIGQIGDIVTWNSMSALDPIWTSERANTLTGVDFNSLAPLVHRPFADKIDVFVEQFCRPLTFIRTNNLQFVGPLSSQLYSLDRECLKSGAEHEPNRGFCLSAGCKPSGLLDLNSCSRTQPMKMELPLLASKPHFLDVDLSVRKSVDGLMPDSKYHESNLHVDERTGVILKAEYNYQVNVEINQWALKQSSINTTHSNSLFVPIYWIQMKNEVTSEFLDFLNQEPFTTLEWVSKWPNVFFGAGIFVNMIGWCIFTTAKKQQRLIQQIKGNLGQSILSKVADTSIFNTSTAEDAEVDEKKTIIAEDVEKQCSEQSNTKHEDVSDDQKT